MKVNVVKPWYPHGPIECDLSEAVSASLDDPERLSLAVWRIREFCGEIANALVTRGHLDLADVIRALPSGHGIVESEGP